MEMKDRNPKSHTNINVVLLEVGGVGKYQAFTLFWSFLFGMVSSMHYVILVFVQGDMAHTCVDDIVQGSNSSLKPNDTDVHTCFLSKAQDIKCMHFEYSSEYFKGTIVSEFDLVCDKAFLVTLCSVLYQAIRIPGGTFAGQMVDRYGRKKSTIVSLFLTGVIGVIISRSVNLEMYLVFRCLQSIASLACYDAPATLLSEITAPRRRGAILIGQVFSWALGILSLSGLGYWLRYWRDLHIAASIISLSLATIACWVLDESPHWLYSQGRYKECQEVINKMARWNKIKLTNRSIGEDNYVDTDSTSNSNDSFLTLMKSCMSREVAFPLLICAYGWLTCNMAYSGLAIGVADLVGGVYLNNAIGAGTEMIAYLITFLVLCGGRKRMYVVLLLIGGAGLISNGVISTLLTDMTWLVISTTMIGRLCVSSAWQILFIWCLELFPTTLRVSMLHLSLIAGYIGGTVAPLINDLPQIVDESNPIGGKLITPVVYGVMLTTSGLLSIILPETSNRPLRVKMSDKWSDEHPRFLAGGISYAEPYWPYSLYGPGLIYIYLSGRIAKQSDKTKIDVSAWDEVDGISWSPIICFYFCFFFQ